MPSVDPVDLADALRRWEADELGAPASVEEVEALRHELEGVARAAAAEAGPADLATNPIRLAKRRITDLLACERYVVETGDGDGRSDDERVHRGVLVDLLAEHHVLTGRPRPDPEPLELGLDLCRALGREKTRTVEWVEALDPTARKAFADEVAERRDVLLAGWPAFAPRWWARTQEPVHVGLADGEVVLAGRADVVVGGPPTPWPALVIEVKSGTFGMEERDDGLVYALLLALRDGRAPAAAITATAVLGALEGPERATARAGRVHVERGTADRLRTAAGRVADAISRAGALAGGRPPVARANRRCDWCPARSRCEAARDHRRDRS
jgi:PD-(D/E)XK nuclease superfamily